MENGEIADDQITASSFRGPSFEPWDGRLNNDHWWATNTRNPSDPWIQVNLGLSTLVTGIITQGGWFTEGWFTEYIMTLQVQYGTTEDTLMYISEDGDPKVST